MTRVRDIARVELGSQDYSLNAYLDNKVATAIVIFQNRVQRTGDVVTILAMMEQLSQTFHLALPIVLYITRPNLSKNRLMRL